MTVVATVGAVVAVLLAVGALGHKTWDGILNLHRWAKLMEKYASYIDGELRHNGGDTLRDMVACHSAMLDEQTVLLQAVAEQVAEQRERLDRIDNRWQDYAQNTPQ